MSAKSGNKLKLCTNKNHLELLPVSDFNKRGNGYQPWCRECMKTNSKQHYSDNPEYYAVKRDDWRKSQKT
jgi:hypothetical protein